MPYMYLYTKKSLLKVERGSGGDLSAYYYSSSDRQSGEI